MNKTTYDYASDDFSSSLNDWVKKKNMKCPKVIDTGYYPGEPLFIENRSNLKISGYTLISFETIHRFLDPGTINVRLIEEQILTSDYCSSCAVSINIYALVDDCGRQEVFDKKYKGNNFCSGRLSEFMRTTTSFKADEGFQLSSCKKDKMGLYDCSKLASNLESNTRLRTRVTINISCTFTVSD